MTLSIVEFEYDEFEYDEYNAGWIQVGAPQRALFWPTALQRVQDAAYYLRGTLRVARHPSLDVAELQIVLDAGPEGQGEIIRSFVIGPAERLEQLYGLAM